ncbi:MAG: hypothetical protein PF517_07905, partial [Salinivirgaceae bacterium]|nr:hypothetical protein [Salinivirgaceae bacterium]
MRLFRLLVVFILFGFITVYAQENNTQTKSISVEIGFLTELTIVNSNMEYLNIAKKDSSLNDIYPLSLFLSGRVNLTSNICLEFRPGFIFGGEYYTGIEYGFYFRYYFDKYYIISGVNFHYNFGSISGMSHRVDVTHDTSSLINVSLGYKMSSHLGFLISYYHPLWEYKMYH